MKSGVLEGVMCGKEGMVKLGSKKICVYVERVCEEMFTTKHKLIYYS